MAGRYLMVLTVPGRRTGPSSFEIEGAFAEHLVMLRRELGELARTLVVAGTELTPEQHAAMGDRLTRIDESQGIEFRPMFPHQLSRAQYLRRLPEIMKRLRAEVEKADVVHAGCSFLYRPFEFPALLMASRLGKKTISITDIDHRQTSRMNYATGTWSLKEYVVNRVLHDNVSRAQLEFAVRHFSLVLLKGKSMAEDYGRGRPNVKSFLDSAFSREHIIPAAALDAKCRRLADPSSPITVVYCGRLVAYKGVDEMLRGVRRALDRGARFHFEIIGNGPEEAPLRALSAELGLDEHVTFVGALPFGPVLFQRLYDAHVLLAAPQREDTPRSALDAFAAGEAIVAYDTYYYCELAESGAPVELVPWRDHQALGDKLAAVLADRARLAEDLRRAVRFAGDNTQEQWLERRVQWTKALFGEPAAAKPVDQQPPKAASA